MKTKNLIVGALVRSSRSSLLWYFAAEADPLRGLEGEGRADRRRPSSNH